MWVTRQVKTIMTLRRGNNCKAKAVMWSLRGAAAGHRATRETARMERIAGGYAGAEIHAESCPLFDNLSRFSFYEV
jgi:hypothetical protein